MPMILSKYRCQVCNPACLFALSPARLSSLSCLRLVFLAGLTLCALLLLQPGAEDEDNEEEDALRGMRIPIARTGDPRKENGALVCEVGCPVLCLPCACALQLSRCQDRWRVSMPVAQVVWILASSCALQLSTCQYHLFGCFVSQSGGELRFGCRLQSIRWQC